MSAEIIHVSFQSDSSGEKLIVPTPQTSFTLSAGTSVSWLLSDPNVPPGSLLYVHFDTRFGPFHGIRSVTPHALLARGNNGEPDLYTYFLYLIIPAASDDQLPRIVRSENLFIDNQSSERDISPEATLTWVPTPPTQKPEVIIEPPNLRLFEGDTVLWHVRGLPQNLFPTFQFIGSSEAAGPFPSVFSLRGVPADPETGLLLGATFSALPLTGQIQYRVQIWNEQGMLIWHDDPSIDSLGKPPGG